MCVCVCVGGGHGDGVLPHAAGCKCVNDLADAVVDVQHHRRRDGPWVATWLGVTAVALGRCGRVDVLELVDEVVKLLVGCVRCRVCHLDRPRDTRPQ